MPKEFEAFSHYQELFEANKDHIVTLWVSDGDVEDILTRQEISVEYFSQKFAMEVLEYFLSVARHESRIGDCPVMSAFLQFLRDKDITSSELFTICTKFRMAMVNFTYTQGINSEAIYNDIAYIFDLNFAGVLTAFSKTIKQAELDLRKVDQLLTQYKAAVDQATLVSKTDEKGVITFVNDRYCQVTGYTKEEFIGQTHGILRDENMTSRYFRDMWKKIESGNIFHGTIKNRAKDGSVLYFDSVITPLFDEDGLIIGYMSIVHDITEQVLAVEKAVIAEEIALLAKDDAIRAEKSKDDFLSNMSHEIRTPMNAILGFVQLLNKADLGAQERSYLDVISNAGNSLLTIINDILDFAKIRSGKFTLDPFEFDPFHEFENTVELFNSKAIEKKIKFLVYIDPHLPGILKGDAVRIKQIMINFLSNAMKFTPEEGTIHLEIRFDAKSSRLCIDVKDSGIGIKKENQAKIFGAFSQEKVDTTRKFGGTGLGLSICENLAYLMEGEIGLDSKEGEGSTFYVHIPIEVVQAKEPYPCIDKVALVWDRAFNEEYKLLEKYLNDMEISYRVYDELHEQINESLLICSNFNYKSNEALYEKVYSDRTVVVLGAFEGEYESSFDNVHKLFFPLYPTKLCKAFGVKQEDDIDATESKCYKGHLLVAEDNKTNQMLITILLQEYGLTYDLAEDGLQAFEKFQKGSYDLVLMDNNMPNMSGLEATEKILAFEQKSQLPHTVIIALTANATNEDKEGFLASGMDDFLAKPIDVQELERILDIYLEA